MHIKSKPKKILIYRTNVYIIFPNYFLNTLTYLICFSMSELINSDKQSPTASWFCESINTNYIYI